MQTIMKNKLVLSTLAFPALLISALISQPAIGFAQGTAFTYQGQLSSGGSPANGSYDLQFGLWSAASGPSQIGSTLTSTATAVSNGLFTVTLDFGANFPGADRWMEIGVRPSGPGAFSTLSPRQKLTPSPYAIMAGSVQSTNILGPTDIGTANLVGTLPDARLSANVALRSGGNMFSGDQIITSGKLGIGTTNPVQLFEVSGYGGQGGVWVTDLNLPAYVWGRRANSFGGPLLAVNGNDGLMSVYGAGYDGTEYTTPRASMDLVAYDNWTSTSQAAYIAFSTTPFGTTSPAERLRINADGNVGIGNSSPSFKLDVSGGIRCIGAVNTTSDARYKTNVEPLSDALDKVVRLRGVAFDWKRAEFPKIDFSARRQIGFIAQEVREVLPEVVSEDHEGYLSIGYSAIVPVLADAVTALKKQKDAEIAALKADNAILAQKLTALEARDQAREARLARLEDSLDDRPARLVRASFSR